MHYRHQVVWHQDGVVLKWLGRGGRLTNWCLILWRPLYLLVCPNMYVEEAVINMIASRTMLKYFLSIKYSMRWLHDANVCIPSGYCDQLCQGVLDEVCFVHQSDGMAGLGTILQIVEWDMRSAACKPKYSVPWARYCSISASLSPGEIAFLNFESRWEIRGTFHLSPLKNTSYITNT